MAEKTTVEGGLVLTFARWQENWAPEVLLPKFGEVGKTIVDRLDPNTSPWELEGTPTSIVEEFLAKDGHRAMNCVPTSQHSSAPATAPLGQSLDDPPVAGTPVDIVRLGFSATSAKINKRHCLS